MLQQNRLVQLVGIVLLLGVTVPLAVELWNASQSRPCPELPTCYPWGAEGPAAGRWRYAAKSNYLLVTALQLALFAGTGLYLICRAARPGASSSLKRALVACLTIAAVLLFFV